jgi:hypothetical protein
LLASVAPPSIIGKLPQTAIAHVPRPNGDRALSRKKADRLKKPSSIKCPITRNPRRPLRYPALSPRPSNLKGDPPESVPNSAFRVEADAVGAAVAKVGPDTAVRQVSLGAYGEGGQSPGVGFGDDHRRVVRGDRHAVGEGEAVSDLTDGAVRRDQRDGAGRESSPAIMSKPGPLP